MPFPFFSPFLLLVHILVFSNPKHEVHARKSQYFDRAFCLSEIIELQKTPGFSKNTPEYFAYDAQNGVPLNETGNLTVTFRGCEEFCGPPTLYFDAVPRIITWIVPVFLLLSNIELSPIDKKRFMTIVHALGDPVDSFWSIVHKIYVWDRLYEIGLRLGSRAAGESLATENSPFTTRLRQRWLSNCTRAAAGIVRRQSQEQPTRPPGKLESISDEETLPTQQLTRMANDRAYRARIIATVLSGFEELAGPRIKTEMYYHMIIRRCGRLGEETESAGKFEEWRKCARELADARTNEYLRTYLAIAVYFLDLIAAFVPAVGGGSRTPPGGRIGSALFLSWLIPLALFSNSVGAFTSRRVCLHIMRRFVAATVDRDEADEQVISPTRRKPSNGSAMSPSMTVQPTEVDITFQGPNENADGLADSHVPLDDAAQWAHDLHHTMFSPSRPAREYNITRLEDQKLVPCFASRPIPRGVGTSADSDIKTRQLKLQRPSDISTGTGSVENMREKELPSAGPYNSPRLKINNPFNGVPEPRDERVELIPFASWDEYFQSLQWLGAIYTYRPWKFRYQHVDHQTHAVYTPRGLVLAGIFPILLSTVAASAIMWYAVPDGFSCRNVWIVGIFLLWLISAAITTGAHAWGDRGNLERNNPLHHLHEAHGGFPPFTSHGRNEANMEHRIWKWIILKDAVVAVVCGLTIFLSTAGIFNNCYCWTGYMTKKDEAVLPMNTENTYRDRAQGLYSGIVISCIGLQMLFFFAVAWYWRRGLGLARWHEEDKLREWEHEYDTGENGVWSPLKYLIFWYYKKHLDTEESRRERKASEYEMRRRPSYFKEVFRSSLSWTSQRGMTASKDALGNI